MLGTISLYIKIPPERSDDNILESLSRLSFGFVNLIYELSYVKSCLLKTLPEISFEKRKLLVLELSNLTIGSVCPGAPSLPSLPGLPGRPGAPLAPSLP